MIKVLHKPEPGTILMVEMNIKEVEKYPAKMELWASLPKKVQYQTFKSPL